MAVPFHIVTGAGRAVLDDNFEIITDGAGLPMWDMISNTMADVPEFWEFINDGPGAWTYDQTLAGWTVLAEAADPDAAKFQNEIRKILGKLEREEKAIAKRTAKIVNDYRNDILANVQWEAMTEWDQHRLAQLDRTMKAASKQFRDQMTDVWKDAANRATAMALAGIDNPMKAIGMVTGAIPPRLPTKALAVMNEFMPRLIKDITEDTMKRVRREATMVMTGTKRPAAARAAIGGAIGDLEVTTKLGRTYTVKAYTRARNLMRTEFNRVNNLVSTQRIDQLADDAGQGVGKKWLHRKSHAPRQNHAALNGKVIWPADGELFNVAGTMVSGPHDPALPAKESVNCHCRLVVHVDIKAFKAAYKTPTERDAAKAAAKAKTGAKVDGKAKPAPVKKPAKVKAKPPVKAKPAAKVDPSAVKKTYRDLDGNPEWADPRTAYNIDPSGKTVRMATKEKPMSNYTVPRASTSPAALKRLNEFEDGHFNKPVEWGAIVDEKGNMLLSKKGQKHRIKFSASEAKLARGATLTHNHPNFTAGKFKFSGASFSDADIKFVFNHHARGIRATGQYLDGRRYVHIIEVSVPDGVKWANAGQSVVNYQKRQVRELQKKYATGVKSGKIESNGPLSREQIHHEAWTRTNERYPFINYRREFLT